MGMGDLRDDIKAKEMRVRSQQAGGMNAVNEQ